LTALPADSVFNFQDEPGNGTEKQEHREPEIVKAGTARTKDPEEIERLISDFENQFKNRKKT